MKFSIAAAFTGLVALVSAVPQYRGAPSGGYYGAPSNGQGRTAYTYPASGPPAYTPPAMPQCLNSTSAGNLVSGFVSLLTNYNSATANALLDANFTDTSNSINMLGGYPLDGVTFPSKAAFMAGQGSQKPLYAFNVLSIDDVTCTNVTFRWSTTVTPTGLLVKGVNSFVASYNNNTVWQIKTMYSEFNAWAWAKNVGLA